VFLRRRLANKRKKLITSGNTKNSCKSGTFGAKCAVRFQALFDLS
jgi:hypothetical protein